jgi:transposase
VEEITEEAAELVERVAGLDIGKASLVCCVQVPHESRPGRCRRQVRTFATTTGQLLVLRDWLAAEGVTRCVMEATSAYVEAAVLRARRRRCRVLAGQRR